MITEDINNKIEIIKQSGTINPDAPIYAEFNDYAQILGLDVVFSVFKDKQTSHAAVAADNGGSKSVSTISIFLKTTQNLLDNNIDKNDSNWSSRYIHTNILTEFWNKLLDKYNYPTEYNTVPTLIFIYSFENFIITQLVYLCKKEIENWIKNNGIYPYPEYIFSSSFPSYNIIFKSKYDYNIFRRMFAKTVNNQIHEILKSNDQYGYYNENKVKIDYLHKEMEDINLYGLSRED
jgi:hypothetical protein